MLRRKRGCFRSITRTDCKAGALMHLRRGKFPYSLIFFWTCPNTRSSWWNIYIYIQYIPTIFPIVYSNYIPTLSPVYSKYIPLKFPLLGQRNSELRGTAVPSSGARSWYSISRNMGMQHRRSKISERLWSTWAWKKNMDPWCFRDPRPKVIPSGELT